MNSIKEKVITTAMNERERIYIHAYPHEKLSIGKRGLIGNERSDGIVLSISPASCTDFRFEETGLSMRLRFSGVWENVFIPFEAIDAVLDNLNTPSFVFNFPKNSDRNDTKPAPVKKDRQQAEIIRPDFTKKKS